MRNIRLKAALVCVAGMVLSAAHGQDAAPPPPAAAAKTNVRPQVQQVLLLRLKHSDPAAIARELSAIFQGTGLRVAADPRQQAVIVAGSAELQTVASNLVAQRDVAAPGGEPPNDNTAVAVLRASPIVQKAITDLEQGIATVTTGNTTAERMALPSILQRPASGGTAVGGRPRSLVIPSSTVSSSAKLTPASPPTGGRIQVLRIPGVDATAVAKALAELAPSQGRKPNVIIVMPRNTSGGQTSAERSP